MSEFYRTYIAQGEQAVGRREGDVITTILGSCVSVCFWDPAARVGGMNHMLLPEAPTGELDMTTGAVDLERLINAMARHGGDRRRLRAKVFGGASMLSGLTDIGARNVQFAIGFLQKESIECDAQSTGGGLARQIRFWPESGAVKLRFIKDAPTLRTAAVVERHDVELF